MKLTYKKIEDFAEVIAGQSPPSNYYNKDGDGLSFFQGKADFGDKYPEARNWCTSPKGKIANVNDILISVRAPVGPVNLCNVKSIIGRGLSAIRVRSGYSYEYLYYYLKRNENKISKIGTGSTFKAITQKQLNSIRVPIPENYDDQIRIAKILSCAETIIAKRKESIRLLDELLKSIFMKMFGDPVANPKGYSIRNLSEFYINPNEGTKCGPFGSTLKKQEYTQSGVPVWTMDNISIDGRFVDNVLLWIEKEKFEQLRGYSVINGDVIISRAGTVGKICVLNSSYEDSIISTNLIRVRFGKELLPIFFVSLMNYFKDRVARLKTGSDGAFTHMNTGILDKIKFPYPPLSLQNNFAQVVEIIESVRFKYELLLREYEKLYSALCQRAFRGELDLSRIPVDDDIKPDPAKQKSEGHTPEVLTTKQFPSNELIGITETKPGQAIFKCSS